MKRLILLGIGYFFMAAQGWAQSTLPEVEPKQTTDEHNKEVFIGSGMQEMPYIICEQCKDFRTSKELDKCTNERLIEFVYGKLIYPKAAKDSLIEGKVFISFDIEIDGTLSNIQLVKDIGGGCGEEALRVTRLLAATYQSKPSKMRGKEVRIKYNLPIQFKLKQ